jgi:alcohol dehydrogenase class IV
MFSDTFAVRGIQLISKNLKQAYQHGDNMDARAGMALGAFYGGIAISTAAGVILGHCISETIGPRYKIPHGLACGIALPYTMKFNIPAATERIASLLPHLSNAKVSGTKARASKVVQVISRLVKELGVSLALKDYGISKEQALDVAKFIANEQQKNYALSDLNPRPIHEVDMISLFGKMWEGKI